MVHTVTTEPELMDNSHVYGTDFGYGVGIIEALTIGNEDRFSHNLTVNNAAMARSFVPRFRS